MRYEERSELTPPFSEGHGPGSGEGPRQAKGFARLLWSAAGTFFLVIGVIGIAVPVLPTTPFLLLAAACYLRGSRRMYDWMMTNKVFGTHLRNYYEGKGVSWRVKASAIIFLWVVISITAIFFTSQLWIRALLVIIAAAVSIHVATIRPKRRRGQGGAA